jgi:hypothetical protein
MTPDPPCPLPAPLTDPHQALSAILKYVNVGNALWPPRKIQYYISVASQCVG